MKLSTVALITLVMISVGYFWRIIRSAGTMIEHPMLFVSSSIGTWALMFFFLMLYLHSRDD